jgi:ABC-type nitrate/sulfonate/bicarbonate transport system substrate-binding protein
MPHRTLSQALLSAWLAACWLAVLGCTRATNEEPVSGLETAALRYEGTPGNVSIAELAEDLGFLAPLRLDFKGNNMTGGPHSIQAVLTGDLDVGGSFNGAIIKIIAAGAPLTSVIAAYGTDELSFQGFYALEGSPVTRPRDFIGKKVAINTLGAHAEFALRDYLARAGLTVEEIAQVTMLVLPSSTSEQALRSGQVDLACLATIFRDKALARGGLRLVFSDYQLFGSFNAGSYVMSKSFIAKHPNAARKYVEGVGEAIEWARSQPRAEVVTRLESIIGKRGRNEDTAIVEQHRGQPARLAARQGFSDLDRLAGARRAAPAGASPAGRHLHESVPANLRGGSSLNGSAALQAAPSRRRARLRFGGRARP